MSRRPLLWSLGATLCGLAALASSAPATPPAATGSEFEQLPRKFIVVYREAPLATYQGDIKGLPAPQHVVRRAVGGASQASARIDARSGAAQAYVRHLHGQQSQHESRIFAKLGRPLRVERRMAHALNGVIAQMSGDEADTVRALPEVQFVEEYREYALETDVGPALIGAPQMWNAASGAVKGEGVVFGIIDSGINFASPSFAAVDQTGYTHTNPLGNGVYLGTCAPGGVDEGRCNSKLIGGYDFVCASPGNACGVAGVREEPGFGDTNSHGSHTASTAAGNLRTGQFRGREVTFSGVAPRANIVAYDVCYTSIADGRGLCPNTSAAAAVDQAIADGVDVINYSIGGGAQPWSEAVSLAFLNAADAGVYVATSAGNSGPVANSLGHLEPWTASTAAAQHGRGDYSYLLQVTGPGAVPEALRIVQLTEGTGAVTFAQTLSHATPLRISAGINSVDDGCVAYPAGTFQGAIAVIRRGTCSFAIKGANAAAAGAVAVVVANNTGGALSPSFPAVTIPSFAMSQADADAVRDFALANGNVATAGIDYPPSPIPNLPDVLGDFSSRGPAGTFDLVKPDITAPGVRILAAVAGETITGSEDAVGLMNGTSMASPHHAGAAGLVRQARPTWSVAEIKSALMMTAKQEVYREDSVTPGTPFDRGAGRVQVDQAVRAGLVLNETRANFIAANPAAGGDVTALNLPSLGKANCAERCVFTRVFRSTQAVRQAWTVKLQGLAGTVSPALFTLNPGESKAVKITVNSTALPANGAWNFGNVVLTPQAVGTLDQPTLRLPVAVAVPPPNIVLTPQAINVSTPAGSNALANVRVSNTGGSRLQFQVDNTGTGTSTLYDAPVGAVASGFRSTMYSDPASVGVPGQFSADDFRLTTNTRMGRLFTPGFVSSGQPLATVATQLVWQIYRDVGGVPEGNPQVSPGVAVWSYSTVPTGAGVRVDGAHVTLDLAAAGQNVTLPAGRYWLVVYARSSFANRWVWFASNTGDNTFVSITPGTDGTGLWSASTGFAGLASTIVVGNDCGASWIGTPNVALGQIDPGAGRDVQVQLNTAGLAAGNYVGYVCVGSNDPARPKVAAAVNLVVTP